MSKWLFEKDDGEDGEFKNKRYGYQAPTPESVMQIYADDSITDIQAAILLNQSPNEIENIKKSVRTALRRRSWARAEEDIVYLETKELLCAKGECPLHWHWPTAKGTEFLRPLVPATVAQGFPHFFREPSLEQQEAELQTNDYGRYTVAPYTVRRDVLNKLIISCAGDMKKNKDLREASTEPAFHHQLKRPRSSLEDLNSSTKRPRTLTDGSSQTEPLAVSDHREGAVTAQAIETNEPEQSKNKDKERRYCKWSKRCSYKLMILGGAHKCEECGRHLPVVSYHCRSCDVKLCFDCKTEQENEQRSLRFGSLDGGNK